VPGVKNLTYSHGTDFLRSLQNAHIYYFTLTTLKNVLRKAGYNFVYGDEFIHSIFKADTRSKNFYFENDYHETITYLKKMEWYRFLPTPYKINYWFKHIAVRILKKIKLYNLIKRIFYKE